MQDGMGPYLVGYAHLGDKIPNILCGDGCASLPPLSDGYGGK